MNDDWETFPHYVTNTRRCETAHLQIQEENSTTLTGYEAPRASYSEHAEAQKYQNSFSSLDTHLHTSTHTHTPSFLA